MNESLISKVTLAFLGHGGGLVVNVHAFCSEDPSLIPADCYNFSVSALFEKTKINEKEAGVGLFFEKNIQ